MGAKHNKPIIHLATIVIISAVVFSFFSTVPYKFVLGKSFTNYLQKISGKPMIIKRTLKATYNNKNYIITLSTPVDCKDELYVNAFEEKLGGVLFRPTYGALQGESKSLYGMLQVFIEDGSDNNFYVVYGYNKDFIAGSYEIGLIKDNVIHTKDITHQEYFLETYQGIVYLHFKDKDGSDISNFFINGA